MNLQGIINQRNQLTGTIALSETVYLNLYEYAVQHGYEGTYEQWLKEYVKGDSGVYIGTEPPEDESVRVWIKPDGEQTEFVVSVNGKTGSVILDAADVGALPDDTPIPVVEYLSNSDILDLWNSY